MEFSRKEYWSRLPFLSTPDLYILFRLFKKNLMATPLSMWDLSALANDGTPCPLR